MTHWILSKYFAVRGSIVCVENVVRAVVYSEGAVAMDCTMLVRCSSSTCLNIQYEVEVIVDVNATGRR